MKKIINPKYGYLEAELLNVVAGNYTPDAVYCNKRNKVEKVTIAGKEFVIKTFKSPHLINRVVYRFFRKSKAYRAYKYAFELIENGVETPYPVACFEKLRRGLFKQGIFISEYVPYKLLENVFEEASSPEELNAILSDFVDFLYYLHGKKIIPMDMNAGNIFYYKDEAAGKYNFALTDINRIEIGREATEKDLMRSLEQCFYPMEKLYHFVNLYAERTCNLPIVYEIFHKVLCLRVKRRKRNLFKFKMREKFLHKKVAR